MLRMSSLELIHSWIWIDNNCFVPGFDRWNTSVFLIDAVSQLDWYLAEEAHVDKIRLICCAATLKAFRVLHAEGLLSQTFYGQLRVRDAAWESSKPT